MTGWICHVAILGSYPDTRRASRKGIKRALNSPQLDFFSSSASIKLLSSQLFISQTNLQPTSSRFEQPITQNEGLRCSLPRCPCWPHHRRSCCWYVTASIYPCSPNLSNTNIYQATTMFMVAGTSTSVVVAGERSPKPLPSRQSKSPLLRSPRSTGTSPLLSPSPSLSLSSPTSTPRRLARSGARRAVPLVRKTTRASRTTSPHPSARASARLPITRRARTGARRVVRRRRRNRASLSSKH